MKSPPLVDILWSPSNLAMHLFSGGFTRHLYQLLLQELKNAIVNSTCPFLWALQMSLSKKPRSLLQGHGGVSFLRSKQASLAQSCSVGSSGCGFFRHRLSEVLFSKSSFTKDLDRSGAFKTTRGLAARRRPRPCRELCSRNSARVVGRPAHKLPGRSP